MNRHPGIYKITSIIKPSRVYIGSSVNIRNRWYEHKYLLFHNIHHSHKLQNHVNKYGYEDLSFEIIEKCSSDWLLQREQYYIDNLIPYFNECRIAGTILGIKRPPEVGRKISKAKKGQKYNVIYIVTEEHKRNLSKASIGVPKSEKHKKNMKGQFVKGQVVPKSTIIAVIEGTRKSWDENREYRIQCLKKGWEIRRQNKNRNKPEVK